MADSKKPDLDADPVETPDTAPDIAPDTVTNPALDQSTDPAEKTETPTKPTPEKAVKRGGFAPALIGGVLAGFLGFAIAQSKVLDAILPDALKGTDMDKVVTALRDADTKQAGELTTLRAEIAAIDQPDLGPLQAQLASVQADIVALKADLDGQLRDIETRLKPLNARLDTLEKQPMTGGASEVAIAAYDRELAALRDAIATQRADVETMIDKARTTEATARVLEKTTANVARNAQNLATVARLHAALDRGAGYGAILADLVAAGVVVPDVLNGTAKDGVVTLAALGDTFPPAARAALSAARTDADEGGGIGGFLQRHLGARSIEPREGGDPDAILSRAEAAITDGNLSQALEEITTLPEGARAEMQDWAESATKRLAALNAADQLAQSLNIN